MAFAAGMLVAMSYGVTHPFVDQGVQGSSITLLRGRATNAIDVPLSPSRFDYELTNVQFGAGPS